MKALVLGSAAMGLGIGVTTLWALRQSLHQRFSALRRALHRLFAREPFCAKSVYEVDWVRNLQHQDLVSYQMKLLHHNHRTGSSVMLVRYPAGEVNPPHRHAAGHGFYVLQGTLVTDRGSFHRDTYVWFPPNETMCHGAGPDEDLVALFFTEENLRTEYVND